MKEKGKTLINVHTQTENIMLRTCATNATTKKGKPKQHIPVNTLMNHIIQVACAKNAISPSTILSKNIRECINKKLVIYRLKNNEHSHLYQTYKFNPITYYFYYEN
jgi:hypothetical protein